MIVTSPPLARFFVSRQLKSVLVSDNKSVDEMPFKFEEITESEAKTLTMRKGYALTFQANYLLHIRE